MQRCVTSVLKSCVVFFYTTIARFPVCVKDRLAAVVKMIMLPKYYYPFVSGWSRRQLYQHESSVAQSSDTSVTTPHRNSQAFLYKSPVAIDIELKTEEMTLKRAELQSLQDAYNTKASAFNINVSKDKTRKRCAKCHLRVNHTHRNCDIGTCEDIRQYGELDYHPEQKTEINELIKKNNKMLKGT